MKMSDFIKDLPTSPNQSSDVDVKVMNELFGDVSKSLELKKLIIPAITFFVLSLPMVDDGLKKMLPDSEMVLLFTKTLIFLVVMIVVQLTNK